MSHDLPADLGAQNRLELRRWLGEGASGTVYEAFDAERGTTVAVKVLRQLGPADLYRFKNEFRTLADVVHPNLVQLYELFSDGERWSFTMELVDGVDFCSWVRGDRALDEARIRTGSQPTLRAVPDSAALAADSGHGSAGSGGARLFAEPLPPSPRPDLPPPPELDSGFDEARLRGAAVQLAHGLTALHGAGKLHRDLKPSNVLVAPNGRVVLLDFGLIRDAEPNQTYQSLHEGIVGTPAYMAPEQAAGLNVNAASDWYAVGAMLYEALAGRPPFVGRGLQVLVEKQSIDPPPPSRFMHGVDAAARARDLQDLAMDLLARDAARRPTGRTILKRLGGTQVPRGPFASQSTSWPGTPRLVGRDRELRALHEAFETARRRQVTVLVGGAPGSGKSALVRGFLDELRADRDTTSSSNPETPVVLTGRCYLNESLPYKAVDSLMDALSRYLRGLPREQAQTLVPADVQALARLFPVLGRVEAVSAAERKVLEVPDSLELRRRAFGALRELFGRMAARQPLVLYIDDLQWGDADSAALLAELARPPDPPPLLLLGCVRTDDGSSSPLVESLRKSATSAAAGLELRELSVGPLALADSEVIARQLLAERPAEPSPSGDLTPEESERLRAAIAMSDAARRVPDAGLATVLARASAGNPFFLQALVRYAQALSEPDPRLTAGAGNGALAADPLRSSFSFPSLDALVRALLARLPAEARALLEVVAVAGHPLTLSAASRAARLDDGLQTALTVLRAGRLVIVREAGGTRWIEAYLTRIAEAVDAVLEPERRRALHARIAASLLLDPQVDPEALAVHFRAAGEETRAAEYALQAARRAREALAFDREVELLRLVLELGGQPGHPDAERRTLMVELGEAATNAGRGAEAAAAYLAAAPGAKAGEAIELRRRAAEQLLVSGRIDEGLAAIEQVLASIGMRLPKTSRAAFLSLVWRRLLLRLRGIRFRERDSTQVASERLIAIDTCWSVTVGLGLVDTIRGLDFGTRGLLLALNAGEPSRVARALALEIGVSGTSGTKNVAATEEMVKQAMRLAKKLADPRIEGLATVTSGMAAYLRGDFTLARERLERGERILRERCRGVTWELDTATTMLFRALLFLGDWAEIRRRLPAALEGFAARGDLYAETNVRSRMGWVARLMLDQPDEARREAREAIARWSHKSFHLQHYWQLTGLAEIALYEGRGEAAWEEIEASWPKLAATHLLRVQFTRIEAKHLRLRAAVAAMAASGLDGEAYRRLQPLVHRELRTLEREAVAWAAPLLQLLRAGIAALEGNHEDTVRLLESAAEGCDRSRLSLYAAAARIRRAELLDRPDDEAARAATNHLRTQGALRPEKWCDVLVPGFTSPRGRSTDPGGRSGAALGLSSH
ncbi:MAG TPA: protein kinase [Thermoanaerobaculia bacterium]|nr:protein kinase [Thermoanaerobaculia bacterium]